MSLPIVSEEDALHEKIIVYTEFNRGKGPNEYRWHFYLRMSEHAKVPDKLLRNAWYWLDLRVVDARRIETDPEKFRAKIASRFGIPEEQIEIKFYK